MIKMFLSICYAGLCGPHQCVSALSLAVSERPGHAAHFPSAVKTLTLIPNLYLMAGTNATGIRLGLKARNEVTF